MFVALFFAGFGALFDPFLKAIYNLKKYIFLKVFFSASFEAHPHQP